jgi:hypothetical protein
MFQGGRRTSIPWAHYQGLRIYRSIYNNFHTKNQSTANTVYVSLFGDGTVLAVD